MRTKKAEEIRQGSVDATSLESNFIPSAPNNRPRFAHERSKGPRSRPFGICMRGLRRTTVRGRTPRWCGRRRICPRRRCCSGTSSQRRSHRGWRESRAAAPPDRPRSPESGSSGPAMPARAVEQRGLELHDVALAMRIAVFARDGGIAQRVHRAANARILEIDRLGVVALANGVQLRNRRAEGEVVFLARLFEDLDVRARRACRASPRR